MTKQIIDSYPLDLVSPVDWSDETQNINDRVRSYLDVNCGHCHSPTGNANSTGLYLHLDETRDIHLGVYKKPVATGRGSGGLKYSIVPGKPEESILLHRMISLDPGVMMPESGRALSHKEAVEMVRDWILLLKE
jgi:Planctomycete cytochrome C.